VRPDGWHDRIAGVVGTLVVGACAAGASGDEWRRLAERGIEAFEAGRYAQAVSRLDEARNAADQPVPEVLYNLACAHAAGGDFALAEPVFREADRLAASREVRVRSRFNLGHALFAHGRSLVRTDVGQAIEVMIDSSRAYKAAWRLDPSDARAAKNVEIVRRHIQLLRDQLEMPEDLAGQASRQGEAPPDDTARQEQLQQQAEQSQQTLENAMSQQMSIGDPQQAEEARRLIEQARQHQQQAREAMERNSPAEAREQQEQASAKLRETAERMREMRERAGGEPPPQERQQDQRGTGGERQEEEPSEADQQDRPQEQPPEDALVESLLEKERRDRKERDEHRRSLMRGALRVEKDW